MMGWGRRLIVAQAVGQGVAIHLAQALVILRQDRGRGAAGQIAAHHDFDRQDGQPLADDDIGVGVGQDMVGAKVGGGVEPEPGDLGQDLALVGDGGKDAVKGRNAVGRNQDAAAVGVFGVGGRS